MTDYQELHITVTPFSEAACDLLAAFLADEGYESFVSDETGLTAYIAASAFSPATVESVIDSFPMPVKLKADTKFVEGHDWNEEWEKNYFKPIVVGDRCVIHSSFHKDIPRADYDIVIDPRMAFGTGHHATTSLMLSYLLDLPLDGARVIDMGTGTGILAILCVMRGATHVDAIEIDPGACDNARDNVRLNSTAGIEIICGDAARLEELPAADLLTANINRNIILADFDAYAGALKEGGSMLLSGFYEEDVPLIEARALPLGLRVAEKKVRDKWCALRLVKGNAL